MKNIKNSIYGVIHSLTTPILMLIITPVFLNYVGIEGYAIWVLVNSIIASLALFNFSGADVIVRFISTDAGKDDADEVFSTVFTFQLIVAVALYILFLIVAPVAIQHIYSDNLLTLVNILYVAIPLFFIKQLEVLLYAFFMGQEQFGHMAVISVSSKILFFLTQALTAIFTKDVLDVFYGALTASFLLFLSQALYIKIMHKGGISFRKANIETAKSLLNFGGWNGLSSLVNMLKSQSDKWLISGFLGLKTFGFYSIGVLIFNQLHTVMTSSIYWIFPEVSKESLDKEALAKKYWKLLFYICIVSLVVSIVLINFNFLFQFWLGDEVFQNSKYYINTFLLLLPVFTLTIVPYLYLLGLGLVKHKFFADTVSILAKVITIWLVIAVFNIEEWVLFFVVFIAIEYIAYAIIISRNLPIKFTHLIGFFLLQVIIVFARV